MGNRNSARRSPILTWACTASQLNGSWEKDGEKIGKNISPITVKGSETESEIPVPGLDQRPRRWLLA